LIEYSPADISGDLRQSITEAACALAKAMGYLNAGTVEFLIEGKGIKTTIPFHLKKIKAI